MKVALAALTALIAQPAIAQDRPDQKAFFALYKELVETDTTLSNGDCTQAAAQIAARMKTAGFTDSEITLFSVPEHPKEGGIVATLKGSDAKAKPMLLLGHIDVVEAKRSDWERDPFKLIEEGGYYYGRGTVDDKAMSAIWADSLIRMKAGKFHPKRTIKMALTCGEETTKAWNGAEWLAQNRPELISAEFVFNEGGGGRMSADGKRHLLALQVGEKAAQNYTLTATNPGGHSSQPTPDNAIYELGEALERIRGYDFPVRLTDTTRAFFERSAATMPAQLAAAARKLIADPNDAAAAVILSRDKALRSTLRTSCVATLVNAGHAENALPQRATANVNCRIFPGESVDGTLTKLKELAGPKITVTANTPVRPLAKVPPLDPRIVGPIEKLAAKHFPGVPVVPIMSTGATDAVFLGSMGMPVYGVPGTFTDANTSGVHGLNERISIASLYDARDYLDELARTFANIVF